MVLGQNCTMPLHWALSYFAQSAKNITDPNKESLRSADLRRSGLRLFLKKNRLLFGRLAPAMAADWRTRYAGAKHGVFMLLFGADGYRGSAGREQAAAAVTGPKMGWWPLGGVAGNLPETALWEADGAPGQKTPIR
jgi:hypothetical protein